jgi:hypothetical protein
MPSLWIDALKQFNMGQGAWCIPRKGTEDYKKVRAIMDGGVDAKAAKKAVKIEAKHDKMAAAEIKKASTPLSEKMPAKMKEAAAKSRAASAVRVQEGVLKQTQAAAEAAKKAPAKRAAKPKKAPEPKKTAAPKKPTLKKLGANLDKAIEDVVKDIEITPSLAAALGAVNSKKLKKAVKESDAAVAKIAKKAASPKKAESVYQDKLPMAAVKRALRLAQIFKTKNVDKAGFIKELVMDSRVRLTTKELNDLYSELSDPFHIDDYVKVYNKAVEEKTKKGAAAAGIPVGKANAKLYTFAEANKALKTAGGRPIPDKEKDNMFKMHLTKGGIVHIVIVEKAATPKGKSETQAQKDYRAFLTNRLEPSMKNARMMKNIDDMVKAYKGDKF